MRQTTKRPTSTRLDTGQEKAGGKDYNIKESVLRAAALISVTAALTLMSCQQVDPTVGYSSRSLYRTDIRTVCIEMFESESFRRGIEYELTRALAQQLELHSPFKVVSDARKADTILYGSINRVTEKNLIQQRELDRPLASEVVLVVTVTWKDQRSGEFIMDSQRIMVAGDYAALLGTGRTGAAKEAANKAALRIIEAMEDTW